MLVLNPDKMKTSVQNFTLKFASGFCLLLFIVSCGPSKEEIEKRRLEMEKKEKEQQEIVKTAMNKYKADMDTFIFRLGMMKEKLDREDTFYVKEGLDPMPSIGSSAISVNFESLGDTAARENESVFGMSGGDVKEILDNYRAMKSGKDYNGYIFYSDDRNAIEKRIAACSIKNTPYALIIECDTVTPIVIGNNSYTGGETLGYCWLTDLRTMEVVGRRMVYASAGEVMVTNKESDWEKKAKIMRSCNDEAGRVIRRWLREFEAKK
jgi:hypothetical protein